MTWMPLSRNEIEKLLADGLGQFDAHVRARWDAIKIEPVKWRCHPHGDLGDGFWVVAVKGNQALWYNDIEDGFNWSTFSTHGLLDEYACNQEEFACVLHGFAQEQSERIWRSGRLFTDLPRDMLDSGQVVAHQPFYCEVTVGGETTYRIHFADPIETLLNSSAYARVELTDHHPLLDHYAQEWAMLDIYSAPENPARVAARLADALKGQTQGWRDLSMYSNGSAEDLLAGSFGLLMQGPKSYVDLAVAILRQEEVKCSVLATERQRHHYRALIFNRCYVIARGFGFELKGSEAGN